MGILKKYLGLGDPNKSHESKKRLSYPAIAPGLLGGLEPRPAQKQDATRPRSDWGSWFDRHQDKMLNNNRRAPASGTPRRRPASLRQQDAPGPSASQSSFSALDKEFLDTLKLVMERVGRDLDAVHQFMNHLRGEIGQGQRDVENRLRQIESKSDAGQNNVMQLLGQCRKEFRDFVKESGDKPFRNRPADLPPSSGSTSRQYRELQEENRKLADRNKSLQEINQATGVENTKLMKETQVMRSKLISLKPTRTELLGDTGGDKYRDLIARLDSWGGSWLAKVIVDQAAGRQFLRRSRADPTLMGPFRAAVQRDQDIKNATAWPETEMEVLTAFISRFLQEELFQKPIYGVKTQAVDFIESMAETMRKQNQEPLQIDRWVAESYYALMANQETQDLRRRALTSMAERLASLIPFLASPNEKREFERAVEEDLLGVAFELHEQILASSQRFRFEFESASEVGRKFRRSSVIKDIMGIASRLDITNACSNGAKLDFKKLKPQPHVGELRRGFMSICTIHPALVVSDLPAGTEASEEIHIMEQQRMLGYWNVDAKKVPPPDNDASWILRLFRETAS
ncbi:hypothetical protein DL767_000030 [Monosporascus sp. MG133]|nr:hypothetical protein DL767_000030 [Monosporascus sp. MG133]